MVLQKFCVDVVYTCFLDGLTVDAKPASLPYASFLLLSELGPMTSGGRARKKVHGCLGLQRSTEVYHTTTLQTSFVLPIAGGVRS